TIQTMRFLAVALVLLTPACAGHEPVKPEPPAKPSAVLIVTIDTLRADRLTMYGGLVATPNIDRPPLQGAWAPQAGLDLPPARPGGGAVPRLVVHGPLSGRTRRARQRVGAARCRRAAARGGVSARRLADGGLSRVNGARSAIRARPRIRRLLGPVRERRRPPH